MPLKLNGGERLVKFGLFGGAKVSSSQLETGVGGDSIGLDGYIEYVLLAESLHYSHAFMVEHHFTGANQVSSSLGLLTYLAGITRTIRLGTAVIVLPWHNPALLAEQVATLDVLSRGRFDFGIGKGYRPEEFHRFGIDMEEAGIRFDETLAFLKRAWTSAERFTHEGRFWSFRDVTIEPPPCQRPHPPIWMGAGSPESIRRAAREGVNLLLDQVGTIDLTIQRLNIYREEKERLGLPFHPDQLALTRGMRVVKNKREAAAAKLEYADWLLKAGALKFATAGGAAGHRAYLEGDAPLIGTPAALIDQIGRLQDGGFSTILLADMTASHEALHTFAAEVMRAFPVSQRPRASTSVEASA
jgi:alkanesulfonate monooxygenase SsuD/methylene tetrahydromethanopterin reductase-like flavin-dependent oxidoreductase (luciferase family)